ncbi:6-bladed beta-propeller [Mongoliibacter ruber]|uniref:6-bladed beta-propeller protein n=1 Tax=Mongoliibacter ruber TaxID=1750599 RepID=A0A2T0WMK2_9BACT|nr:6-bladed beta-propeller [Mongoliibacter ruber]PRY87929.1 6-bladed beta-propeller protein [Mongoliibacter ruber]
MKKGLLPAISLLAVFFGCFSEPKENRLDSVYLDFGKSTPIKASEIFSEAYYLLLEEDITLPLVRPYKTVVQDSIIFVEDKELNNLFVFDNSGKIRTILKSAGVGPNEFIQIDEFSVSENKIYIQDDYLKKTLVFDFKGQLIEEKYHTYFGFNKFYWLGYELTYFDDYSQHGTDFHVLKNGELLISFDIGRTDKGLPPVSHQYGFVPDFSRNLVSFVAPYSYKVAFFNLEDFSQKYVSFDFGKFNFPKEEHINFLKDQWNNREAFVQNKYVSMLGYFGPLKKDYILSVSHGLGDPHWFILDKNFHVKRQFRIKDMENDLDGWILNSAIAWTIDDFVVLKINSNEFYNSVQKALDSGKTIDGNLKEFWDEQNEELLDDRLVLIFLKLKGE